MRGSTSVGYDQFETSPEAIEQELRPAVCERRPTDRLKANYSIDDYVLVSGDWFGRRRFHAQRSYIRFYHASHLTSAHSTFLLNPIRACSHIRPKNTNPSILLCFGVRSQLSRCQLPGRFGCHPSYSQFPECRFL